MAGGPAMTGATTRSGASSTLTARWRCGCRHGRWGWMGGAVGGGVCRRGREVVRACRRKSEQKNLLPPRQHAHRSGHGRPRPGRAAALPVGWGRQHTRLCESHPPHLVEWWDGRLIQIRPSCRTRSVGIGPDASRVACGTCHLELGVPFRSWGQKRSLPVRHLPPRFRLPPFFGGGRRRRGSARHGTAAQRRGVRAGRRVRAEARRSRRRRA